MNNKNIMSQSSMKYTLQFSKKEEERYMYGGGSERMRFSVEPDVRTFVVMNEKGGIASVIDAVMCFW